MKIIAVTDIHGRRMQAEKIAKIAKEGDVDAIIVSGDLSRYKSMEEAIEILRVLNVNKTFYIPGNMDDPKICEIDIEGVECVHERVVNFMGYSIAGVGGSLKGPFNTPFEMTEEEILERLKRLMGNIYDGKLILVTHNPPYNTNADNIGINIGVHEHIGSKSIRMMIERVKPILNVCGHVHEARSIDKIDGTIIVNPGPLMYGYYAEIIVGENVEAKLLKLP
ncbi:MAG: metallophosphoesterase family protein, partial [Candidatus Methanomethylicia archaeon]